MGRSARWPPGLQGPPPFSLTGPRPRQADILQEWAKAQQDAEEKGLNRGDPGAVQDFVNKKKVGPQGVSKLKSQGLGTNLTPVTKTKLPTLPKLPTQTAQRKKSLAEPGYVWSKRPSTTGDEFTKRMAKGGVADDVFREIIADIDAHHRAGKITTRDARRSANEALGRLLKGGQRKEAGDDWQPVVQGKYVYPDAPQGNVPIKKPQKHPKYEGPTPILQTAASAPAPAPESPQSPRPVLPPSPVHP